MAAPAAIRYAAQYNALQELALDLHWSWSHDTDIIWRKLDPVLWELTHNPYVVLQTVSAERINEVLDQAELRITRLRETVAPAEAYVADAAEPDMASAEIDDEEVL